MLLTEGKDKKLEECIIEELHTGGVTGPTLLKKVMGKDSSTSKETFYRTIRKLLKEEVLNKHAQIYQLNRHWLQRLYRFSKNQIKTNTGIDADNILSFKEGDKITYTFKNPNLMGLYWAHTYDMIFEQHDSKVPIIVFHPHEWLIHTRSSSETFFLNRFKEDKKLALFSIGGTSKLDTAFKKVWANEYLQIHTGADYGLKKTQYINVLGDFIFKVSVSKRFSEELEVFFKTYPEITPETYPILEKLCTRNDGAKMVFTRSKKEADTWRIKFKKHFYVSKKHTG